MGQGNQQNKYKKRILQRRVWFASHCQRIEGACRDGSVGMRSKAECSDSFIWFRVGLIGKLVDGGVNAVNASWCTFTLK